MPQLFDYGDMVASLGIGPQNVIFDPWSKKRGVNSPLQTEGAAPMAGSARSGGGWRLTPTHGLGRGTYVVSTRTPSGNQVEFHMSRNPATGKMDASVSFYGGGWGKGTTGRGIKQFSDVMRTVERFSKVVKPNTLSFTPATSKHQRIYDRAAPRMAEQLGAQYTPNDFGFYTLKFPDARVFPEKIK